MLLVIARLRNLPYEHQQRRRATNLGSSSYSLMKNELKKMFIFKLIFLTFKIFKS